MVFGLRACVTTEGGQSSISSTVAVQHENHTLCFMQADRCANLFQDELAIGLLLRRGQALRATGNPDRIGIRNARPPEKFGKPQLEAVVETPNDCSITP